MTFFDLIDAWNEGRIKLTWAGDAIVCCPDPKSTPEMVTAVAAYQRELAAFMPKRAARLTPVSDLRAIEHLLPVGARKMKSTEEIRSTFPDWTPDRFKDAVAALRHHENIGWRHDRRGGVLVQI
jgi:hypothetical protein